MKKKSKKTIVYDCYNKNFPKNQNVIGTVVQHFGRYGMTNGWKIVEVEDEPENTASN